MPHFPRWGGVFGGAFVRVFTDYEDGRHWLTARNTGSPVEIPRWQWLAYRAFVWLDIKVDRWCARLDNAAYEAAHPEEQA